MFLIRGPERFQFGMIWSVFSTLNLPCRTQDHSKPPSDPTPASGLAACDTFRLSDRFGPRLCWRPDCLALLPSATVWTFWGRIHDSVLSAELSAWQMVNPNHKCSVTECASSVSLCQPFARDLAVSQLVILAGENDPELFPWGSSPDLGCF